MSRLVNSHWRFQGSYCLCCRSPAVQENVLGSFRGSLVNNYPSLSLEDEGNTHTVFILNPVPAEGQTFQACGPSNKTILFPKYDSWIQKYFLTARYWISPRCSLGLDSYFALYTPIHHKLNYIAVDTSLSSYITCNSVYREILLFLCVVRQWHE